MRKYLYITIATLLLACNGENVPDCFQNSGSIIQQEFAVATFDKVTVFPRVQLIVRDAPEQRVVVETGEFLLNDIDVYVEDRQLFVKNNNACNLTRDYGITKVFVDAPDLTEIRNSSGLEVSSDGVLNYDEISLLAENFTNDEFHTDGDFDLEVNSNSIVVFTNDLSNVFLKGTVTDLEIGFFSGDGRFEGRELLVDNVQIFHRSSNDVFVNPQLSLRGRILSTGNLISINRPPVVEIEELYTGRLIFED